MALGLVAVALMAIIFIDTFEAMLLPRRVRHSYRLARAYFRSAWRMCLASAQLFPRGKWRNGYLGIFGPGSLLGLIAIWANGLIVSFALLHWSLGTEISFPHGRDISFAAYVYFSGTTFFTLGLGDVVPTGILGRGLTVAEAGIGFGFLALIISYLPVIYQAFSRREIVISQLDARAGSPPTAGEFLRRLAQARALPAAHTALAEWERWSAELLESQLSYPVLSYYRSQHDNQSWVAALTMMLDTSALVIASFDGGGDGGTCGGNSYQARLTFAMARHAAVDMSLTFDQPPRPPAVDRLPPAELTRLLETLRTAGVAVGDEATIARALAELRLLYEPFMNALAHYFRFELPPFLPAAPPVDNWQTSPWMPRSPELGLLAASNETVH